LDHGGERFEVTALVPFERRAIEEMEEENSAHAGAPRPGEKIHFPELAGFFVSPGERRKTSSADEVAVSLEHKIFGSISVVGFGHRVYFGVVDGEAGV
jgi:hypothetical protein